MRFDSLDVLRTKITFAPPESARSGTAQGHVMEIVTFRFASGVTEATFMDAAKATRSMVAARPGFVRRALLCDEAGLWSDTIEWQSLGAAHRAAEILMSAPGFAPFVASIDMSSLAMRHVPILWQMND